MADTKRKEVHLYPIVIERLQTLADRKKWSLKRYMEYVLELNSRKIIAEKIK